MYGRRPVNRYGSGHWAHDDRGVRLNRYFVGRDRHGYYTYYPQPNYVYGYNRPRSRRFGPEDDVMVDDDLVPVPTPRVKKVRKLKINDVDFNVYENSRQHHTDKFEAAEMDNTRKSNPILRRGQSFRLTVTFDRLYSKQEHELKLLFRTGKHSKPNKGTAVEVVIRDDTDLYGKNDWWAVVKNMNGTTVELKVYIPPGCVIGVWRCSVVTVPKSKHRGPTDLESYNYPNNVYILLNPWCEDDTVYMSSEKDLREYVLNESGAVFTGNTEQIGFVPWNFGQFEEGMLEICFYIIEKAFGDKIDHKAGNPIKLSRAISQIVNHNDEGGVLIGRWDGKYSDGFRPTHWSGTPNILKRYYETRTSVKYGQCWVFSAITTTVCRAIGLPCRSVTNFSSAHDSDGSLTIDKVVYRDPKSNEIVPHPHQPKDSIWNFHVWNDVWMARPDLDGYDGWQAIDATPQERSEGLMCCGPAPLKAIKNGECNIPYDTGFVFAEVNGDRVWWEKVNDYDYRLFSVDTKMIGFRLSTKVPNGKPKIPSYYGDRNISDEVNVMGEYKYPEGSAAEEKAVENASRLTKYVRRENPDRKNKNKVVDCKIITDDNVMIGSDFNVRFLLSNQSKTSQVITFTVNIEAMSYTERILGVVKSRRYDAVKLEKKGGEKIKLSISVKDYLKHMDEHESMRITASIYVNGRDEMVTRQSVFRLRSPDIEIQAPNSCKVRSEVDVILSFTNPLPIPLRNCSYGLEGYGNELDIRQRDIPAKTEWKHKVTIIPTQIGQKQITASFDCDELPEIFGLCTLNVENPYYHN